MKKLNNFVLISLIFFVGCLSVLNFIDNKNAKLTSQDKGVDFHKRSRRDLSSTDEYQQIINSIEFQQFVRDEVNRSIKAFISKLPLDTFCKNECITPGPIGPPGKDGKDGENGLPGAEGEMGLIGLTGKPGQDGKHGLPGQRGKDGKNGLSGKQGIDGKNGLPGQQGIDGLDGLPGQQGKDGKDGLGGKQGKDGKDGLTGQQGKDGNDGLPGADGIDGQNGLPGKVGRRGPQGIQGPPGIPTFQRKLGLISPILITSNLKISANITDSKTLSCTFYGNPTPSVKWVHNITNTMISDSTYDFEKSEVKSTISITNLTWSDRGSVSCIGESILGNATVHGYVDVLKTPKIKYDKIFLSAHYGSVYTFPECQAVSSPPAVISWKRGYGIMDGSRFNISNNAITISNIQWSDEGSYICTATNFLGSDEITVKFKTKPLEFLHTPPHNQTFVEGETAMLACSAYGDISTMAGKWSYSKTYLEEETEIQSKTHKNLNIFNTTVAITKSGMYKCSIEQGESTIHQRVYANFANIESNILNIEQKKQLITWLKSSDEKKSFDYNLCMRVSSSFTNLDQNCGSKTNTISIIKDTKGCIFGGYSSTTFDAQTVGNSFLFDFKRNVKYEARSPNHEKRCEYRSIFKFGPCFGRNDLKTYRDSYRNLIFYKGFPFYATDRSYKQNHYVGCSGTFRVATMEILYQN